MKNSKIKIIIVDNNKAFIEAIKFLLSRRADIEIIGEAENGIEFLSLIETLKPDIVLMDIILPELNGIEIVKMSIIKGYDLKFVGITMSDDPAIHLNMKENGFDAGILKNSFFEEFENIIRIIKNKKKYFPVLYKN
ncbi:MAG: response regulator transcription factor [Prolixibacteraceae bacterium]|nr:response regulator transcription factor [Prolixibacteraceae bacterium]